MAEDTSTWQSRWGEWGVGEDEQRRTGAGDRRGIQEPPAFPTAQLRLSKGG